MRPILRDAIALLACFSLASVSLAEEPAKPKLPADAIKVAKPKVALYEQITFTDREAHSGSVTTIKSKKYRLLHVRTFINYQLPEDSETIRVDGDDIHLVQDGGKKHPTVGGFDSDNLYDHWGNGFWLHASNRRNNEMVDMVYAIPADATGPFALVIGDIKTIRVELPKKVSKPPHPADMVDIEVKSIAWGDSVPGEPIRIGKDEIKTTFSVPGRRLLAVSMLVHALDYNDDEGKRLNWNGNGLSLRDKAGNTYPTHGGFFNNYLTPNIGHSAEVGKKSTEAETFFFSPPDDIESFEVLWHGRPVTEYKVKK